MTRLPDSDRRDAEQAHDPKPSSSSSGPLRKHSLASRSDEKRAKSERIGRTAAIFIMPLIIVGMMITGYLGAMHSPSANDMPVAAVGSSQQITDLTQALERANSGAVDVIAVDTAMDARAMVESREVAGSVVIDGDSATLYTAAAAGATQVTTVTALVTPALLEEGLQITAEDLAPLPDNDRSGLGAIFLATTLVMAGYLPFSIIRANSPELLRFRRIVPLMAAWAALIAGLVSLVTGPILGIVSGDNALAVAAIAWLSVFAISAVQLFITRVFGPLGVIVGMLLLMVLGMPASNMSMSIYTIPEFYRVLHEFLPMAAIGESMRSVLYFGGVGVTAHVLVLAVGAVLGLLATATYDALRGHKHPEGIPTDVNIPSLHGGPRQKRKFWRYASLVFFPFAMVTLMLSTMLGAMGAPTPRDMPVAVIGTTVEQATDTIESLEQNLDGYFEFTAFSTADTDDVRTLVEDRELVAALELPSQTSPQFTLVANQAGSPSAYQVAVNIFTQIADAQQLPLTIDDTAPLPDTDSQGFATMYLAMGWIMAGFMVIIVAANAAPATRPLRKILPIAAAYAPFMSAVLWLIAAPITGAIDGHFLPLWGAGTVMIFSVAMFAMVLERLLGMLAVIPVVGILMFLGVPSSNAAFSMYLAPEWFRTLHDFLPLPAAVETVRSILYFGADVVVHNLQVITIWGLVSLALVFVIDSIKTVRTEHDFGNLDTPTTPSPTPKPSIPPSPDTSPLTTPETPVTTHAPRTVPEPANAP